MHFGNRIAHDQLDDSGGNRRHTNQDLSQTQPHKKKKKSKKVNVIALLFTEGQFKLETAKMKKKKKHKKDKPNGTAATVVNIDSPQPDGRKTQAATLPGLAEVVMEANWLLRRVERDGYRELRVKLSELPADVQEVAREILCDSTTNDLVEMIVEQQALGRMPNPSDFLEAEARLRERLLQLKKGLE